MLLTITYNEKPSTDLGYLLHKNPNRPQTVELSYGKAHVFYSEASEKECTAVLLLDIDPIDLARGKKGSSREGGLFDYVNDRPYVVSSFMSVAIARVFGTAMTGRSKERPELAEKELPLKAKIVMLPCKGDKDIINKIFEPIGYKVSIEDYILDDKFPEWGQSKYYNVTLEGTVKLKDLLNHLYVLIPAMDKEKHYWIGDDEVSKLLRHGEGWLNTHPEKKFIINRYLNRKRALANKAILSLVEEEEELEENEAEELEISKITGKDLKEELNTNYINDSQEDITEIQEEKVEDKSINDNGIDLEKVEHKKDKLSLDKKRLEAVMSLLKSHDVRKVIDIGCGEGKLLSNLLKDTSFEKITGVDVAYSALEKAKDRLKLDMLPEFKRKKIELFQGSLTYKDKRFSGYDAATVIEVIEHLDFNRLSAFEKVLFQYAKPKLIVISTPNIEYNENYKSLEKESLRHKDHRFEWTRDEFQSWANKVADRYGYSVEFIGIGENHEILGAPTQMGVFIL